MQTIASFTRDERIAARRARIAAAIAADAASYQPDPDVLATLSALDIAAGIEPIGPVEAAVLAEVDESERPHLGALELLGVETPDFDSGLYDDGSLAITLATAGGYTPDLRAQLNAA